MHRTLALAGALISVFAATSALEAPAPRGGRHPQLRGAFHDRHHFRVQQIPLLPVPATGTL